MAQVQKGGCRCGAVRFSIQGTPKFVANCHCNECRKSTGAAFTTWVGMKTKQFTWDKGAPKTFESSSEIVRNFCGDCGTPLTFESWKYIDEVHILIGAFDEANYFTPTGSAYNDEGLDWVRAIREGG
jgi:hypothetical protein